MWSTLVPILCLSCLHELKCGKIFSLRLDPSHTPAIQILTAANSRRQDCDRTCKHLNNLLLVHKKTPSSSRTTLPISSHTTLPIFSQTTFLSSSQLTTLSLSPRTHWTSHAETRNPFCPRFIAPSVASSRRRRFAVVVSSNPYYLSSKSRLHGCSRRKIQMQLPWDSRSRRFEILYRGIREMHDHPRRNITKLPVRWWSLRDPSKRSCVHVQRTAHLE